MQPDLSLPDEYFLWLFGGFLMRNDSGVKRTRKPRKTNTVTQTKQFSVSDFSDVERKPAVNPAPPGDPPTDLGSYPIPKKAKKPQPVLKKRREDTAKTTSLDSEGKLSEWRLAGEKLDKIRFDYSGKNISVLGFIGKSEAGKTSFLNIISSDYSIIMPQTSGKGNRHDPTPDGYAYLYGKPLKKSPRHRFQKGKAKRYWIIVDLPGASMTPGRFDKRSENKDFFSIMNHIDSFGFFVSISDILATGNNVVASFSNLDNEYSEIFYNILSLKNVEKFHGPLAVFLTKADRLDPRTSYSSWEKLKKAIEMEEFSRFNRKFVKEFNSQPFNKFKWDHCHNDPVGLLKLLFPKTSGIFAENYPFWRCDFVEVRQADDRELAGEMDKGEKIIGVENALDYILDVDWPSFNHPLWERIMASSKTS